jgi:hypothetical protein
MKTKFLSLIVACLVVTNIFSQSNLNNYKYVIVPNQYGFFKEKDKYQLNSLTKFLFNKYGFEAYLEGENYPEELSRNKCLALNSDLINDSAMFKTKIAVVLKDCKGEVVYTTKIGETREKDFTKSYALALRDAFKDIIALNHVYKPDPNAVVAVSKEPMNQNDVVKEIQQLKEELETLKKEKEVAEVVEVKKTTEPVSVVVAENVPVKETKKVQEHVNEVPSSILYAQQIENGFQLVDSSPKVIYKIKNTSLENVYLVEGKNATLYKKGDNWIMEYYESDVLKQEVINIKF